MDAPTSLAFSPDGALLSATGNVNENLVGSLHGLQRWRIPEVTSAGRWLNLAYRMRFQRGGEFLSLAVGKRLQIAGANDAILRVFSETDDDSFVVAEINLQSPATSVGLFPSEAIAVAGLRSGEIVILDLAQSDAEGRLVINEISRSIAHEGEPVTSLAITAGGLIASGSTDRTVRLWGIQGQRLAELISLDRFSNAIQDIRFNSAGTKLAVLMYGSRSVQILHLDRLRGKLADASIDWVDPYVQD